MNVRAWLFDRKEFYYPESDEPYSLAEFYSVLEGYRIKGIEYELTYGLGVDDDSGEEVFTGDVVEITFVDLGLAQQRGFVDYGNGSFWVSNQNGVIYDFVEHASFLDEDNFSMRIISNVYQLKRQKK